jgi:hypothetical protein
VKVTIILKKTYDKIQDAITELNQAETLGFTLQNIEVAHDG